MLLKGSDHLAGPGHQKAHDSGIKKIPVHHSVFLQNPFLVGVVQKPSENLLQLLRLCFRNFRRLLSADLFKLIQLKKLQQAVDGINPVFLRYKSCLNAVLCQFSNICLYHDSHPRLSRVRGLSPQTEYTVNGKSFRRSL